MPYREVESIEALKELLSCCGGELRHCAFQSIDFTQVDDISSYRFCDSIFLGCTLTDSMQLSEDSIVSPRMNVPYNISPPRLYSAEELYSGYDPQRRESFEECYDTKVYRDYIERGKQCKSIYDSLARALHDHSISDALHDMLSKYEPRRIVAVMGGHSLSRNDSVYLKVVRLSKRLSECGFLMLSGGGPGAMEATHLGAWLAGREESDVIKSVEILSKAPTYRDEGWLESAFKVRILFPNNSDVSSIGIPTWFYGHEPATPFATHIAKYFDNSIREDGLLAVAKGGVIYTPGSAGTMQEIFQDAAQNHYETFGFSSPMIFLGKEYWSGELPIYPLLESLMAKGRYKNLKLSLTDSIDEVVATLDEFSIQR